MAVVLIGADYDSSDKLLSVSLGMRRTSEVIPTDVRHELSTPTGHCHQMEASTERKWIKSADGQEMTLDVISIHFECQGSVLQQQQLQQKVDRIVRLEPVGRRLPGHQRRRGKATPLTDGRGDRG
jgi:hypothetical protein